MQGTRTILTAAALATGLGVWPASPAHADQFCYGVAHGDVTPICGDLFPGFDCDHIGLPPSSPTTELWFCVPRL